MPAKRTAGTKRTAKAKSSSRQQKGTSMAESKVNQVASAQDTARAAGARLHKRNLTVRDWRDMLWEDLHAQLSAHEREAYNALLPATFKAAFQAGWQTVESVSGE